MLSRYCFFLLIFLFFGACRNIEVREFLDVSFDKTPKNRVPLSEIAEYITKIELETIDRSILNINFDRFEVEILNQNYLIKDSYRTIKIFDQQGKYVREIGKIGGGPGEYPSRGGGSKFSVNREKSEIIISTNIGLMVYDINNNFIEKGPKLKGYITDMWFFEGKQYFIITDDSLLSNNEVNIFLKVYDSKWNMVDSLLVKNIKNCGVVYDNSRKFSQHQNHLCFSYPLKLQPQLPTIDTVYTIENHRLKPVLAIESNIHKIFNIIFTDRFILASYLNKMDDGSNCTSFLVYDAKTKKSKNTDRGFVDDFFNTGNVELIKVIPNTDKFFFITETEYSENLKVEPNPTLYIGTFKK